MKSTRALEALAQSLPADDREAYQAIGMLLLVSHAAQRTLNGQLAEHGLSWGKFRLLIRLFVNEEGLNPSELAEILGVTRSTMTGLVDGLERCGLLQRQEDAGDRRMTLLRLTPAGRELVRAQLPTQLAQASSLMSGLSAEEQATLSQLLKKVWGLSPLA